MRMIRIREESKGERKRECEGENKRKKRRIAACGIACLLALGISIFSTACGEDAQIIGMSNAPQTNGGGAEEGSPDKAGGQQEWVYVPEALTDLYNAILTKEPMDLIDLSGIHIETLMGRGLLENLSPYLENSQSIDRSDFVDGILKAYTFDDTLTGIPASFYLWTVVGNRARLENQAGLSLDELLKASGRNPEVQTFTGLTREELMQFLMMFNQDTFIDWEAGICHFDSEDFKAVLRYVKQFPDSVEADPEAVSLPVRLRNGEVLFAISEFDSFSCAQEYQWLFGDGACVGFPTPDGKGGHILFTGDAYGIAAVSEHKEGAWQFLEEFLTSEKDEMYYIRANNIFMSSFPTLKKALDEKVEAVLEEDRQTPADKFPRHIYSDGTEFRFHAVTWDDVNVMLELVPEAKPFFDMEGDEIIKIINEEAFGYYSGQRSVEDVAGIIQNRVQLYVDENRDAVFGS